MTFAITDSDVHQLLLNVNTNAPDLHLELAWDGDPPPKPEMQSGARQPGPLKPGEFVRLATESVPPQTWEGFGIAVDLLNAGGERFRIRHQRKVDKKLCPFMCEKMPHPLYFLVHVFQGGVPRPIDANVAKVF